jgi:hypothetical protein
MLTNASIPPGGSERRGECENGIAPKDVTNFFSHDNTVIFVTRKARAYS